MSEAAPEELRSHIISAFPELENSQFKLCTSGWDSLAVDVDDSLIFKFPRDESGEQALLRETNLLSIIQPLVTLPVPLLTFYAGPPAFSRHRKLLGEHLTTAQYELLAEKDRQQLAADVALFYAELHSLDKEKMKAAGAKPLPVWPSSNHILKECLRALPPELHSYAEKTISARQELPPDPYSEVYGFFDGHGWNMAFDQGTNRLNGIYDFADSGFGDLHQEFLYTNWISAELTARIIHVYETLTNRTLDRQRIDLLTGFHRLGELAESANDPKYGPMVLESAITWAECRP